MLPGRFQQVVNRSLRVLCLGIFVASFLLPQLIAYSNPSLVIWSVQHQGVSSIHESIIVKSSASLPEPAHLFGIDIELEPTGNDDSREDDTECSADLSREYAVKEKDLSNGLRISLQHLTTTAQRHQKIPFFILHHSWKAHLA